MLMHALEQGSSTKTAWGPVTNPPHQPRSGELYIKTINVFFCQARVSAGYLSLNSRPFLRPAQKKTKKQSSIILIK